MSSVIKCSAEYFELVRSFPLVPLRTKRQYKQAQEVIRNLVIDPLALTQARIDYIGVLGNIVTEYERNYLPPTPKISGRRMLRFLMKQNDLSISDLAREIGGHRSNLSAFLSGTRSLSKDVAMALSKRFHINVSAFLEN
ncbi:MAG: helix-turn-helix domain-containing protein [Candidatus Obscuribacterales bacterium]|nr:helix-turn-helix domain-containing protein [Candidatus Obscuribacterales bacterium]